MTQICEWEKFLSSTTYHSNGYQAVNAAFTCYANNATMPANTPAAPRTTSDPLICICPFAMFVFAAVVAAALASLFDRLVELVINPLDLVDPVPVASGVAVPLNIVTPVADCSEVEAVTGS